MRRIPFSRAAGGFSLVEVLVSLIIIAVGMLGLAKLQALTYSSTGTSAMRSIAAIEASSLAASMHTNRSYWTAVPSGWSYTFAGASGTPNASDTLLGTPLLTACTAGTCTARGVAARDLAVWRNAIVNALPGPSGSVTCSFVSPNPVTCVISLKWVEGNLSANSNSNGNAQADSSTLPYTLYVVP